MVVVCVECEAKPNADVYGEQDARGKVEKLGENTGGIRGWSVLQVGCNSWILVLFLFAGVAPFTGKGVGRFTLKWSVLIQRCALLRWGVRLLQQGSSAGAPFIGRGWRRWARPSSALHSWGKRSQRWDWGRFASRAGGIPHPTPRLAEGGGFPGILHPTPRLAEGGSFPPLRLKKKSGIQVAPCSQWPPRRPYCAPPPQGGGARPGSTVLSKPWDPWRTPTRLWSTHQAAAAAWASVVHCIPSQSWTRDNQRGGGRWLSRIQCGPGGFFRSEFPDPPPFCLSLSGDRLPTEARWFHPLDVFGVWTKVPLLILAVFKHFFPGGTSLQRPL